MQASTHFCRSLPLVSWGLLLVTRSSCHIYDFSGFSRYEEIQEFGSYNLFPKIFSHLKACSTNFSQSTECPIPSLHPELLSGIVEGQWAPQLVTSSLWGRWQVPIYSWECLPNTKASLIAQLVNHLPALQETKVWFLGWEDFLKKEMATHFSILVWEIPWTDEPGRLRSVGSQESNMT